MRPASLRVAATAALLTSVGIGSLDCGRDVSQRVVPVPPTRVTSQAVLYRNTFLYDKPAATYADSYSEYATIEIGSVVQDCGRPYDAPLVGGPGASSPDSWSVRILVPPSELMAGTSFGVKDLQYPVEVNAGDGTFQNLTSGSFTIASRTDDKLTLHVEGTTGIPVVGSLDGDHDILDCSRSPGVGTTIATLDASALTIHLSTDTAQHCGDPEDTQCLRWPVFGMKIKVPITALPGTTYSLKSIATRTAAVPGPNGCSYTETPVEEGTITILDIDQSVSFVLGGSNVAAQITDGNYSADCCNAWCI